MQSSLTEEETQTLHIFNIFQILDICREYRLPHCIHSTAIIFYRKMAECRPILTYTTESLLRGLIVLACKSENIHGDLTFLVKHLSPKEKDRARIYECETAALLQFNFHISSPYLKMLGIIILLQERGTINVKEGECINLEEMTLDWNAPHYEIDVENYKNNEPIVIEDVNELWHQCVCNMDKVMICDEYFKMNSRECALAALPFPIFLIDDLFKDADVANVERLRENSRYVKCPDRETVDMILDKL